MIIHTLFSMGLLLTAAATSHAGWFRNSEQEALERFEAGDFNAAAEGFSDTFRRGVALYRAHRFADAEDAFAQVDRASVRTTAAYNLGNARFMQGDFTGAIDAYERVLNAEPDYYDARNNLALARGLLAKQEQEAFAQDEQQAEQASPEREQAEAQDSPSQPDLSAQAEDEDQREQQEADQQQQQEQGEQAQEQASEQDDGQQQEGDQGEQQQDQQGAEQGSQQDQQQQSGDGDQQQESSGSGDQEQESEGGNQPQDGDTGDGGDGGEEQAGSREESIDGDDQGAQQQGSADSGGGQEGDEDADGKERGDDTKSETGDGTDRREDDSAGGDRTPRDEPGTGRDAEPHDGGGELPEHGEIGKADAEQDPTQPPEEDASAKGGDQDEDRAGGEREPTDAEQQSDRPSERPATDDERDGAEPQGAPESEPSRRSGGRPPPEQGETRLNEPEGKSEAVERFDQQGALPWADLDPALGLSDAPSLGGDAAIGPGMALMEQRLQQIEGDPSLLMRNQFQIEEMRRVRESGGRLQESRPW